MATLVRGRNSILTHPTIFAFLCPINARTQILRTQNIFRKMGLDWEVWKWAVESANASWWRHDMHFNSLIHYCQRRLPIKLKREVIVRNSLWGSTKKLTKSLLLIFQSYKLCNWKRFEYLNCYKPYINTI